VAKSCAFSGRLGVFFAILHLGCSSPKDEQPACNSFDYAGYSATEDPSFQNEIRPILAASCATLSCHGSSATFPANEPGDQPLDMGPPATKPPPDAAMLQQIHDNLVNVSSITAPALLIVKPGAPESSFMMHKIDGDQGCSGLSCPKGCGKRMPDVEGLELDAATANKIRAWIKQGAKNN
jgi:hypothetical protein